MKERISVFYEGGVPTIISKGTDGVIVYRAEKPTKFVVSDASEESPRSSEPVKMKAPYMADRRYRIQAVTGPGAFEASWLTAPMTKGEAERMLGKIHRGLSLSRLGRGAFRWTALLGGLLVALSFAGGQSGGPARAPSLAEAGAMPPAIEQAAYAPAQMPDLTRNAIKFGSEKDEGRMLLVFSDPQCPFCRDLEAALAKLPKDVAVRVFPVSFKQGSSEIAAGVYCAINSAKAWRGVVLDGDQPASNGAECNGADKVAENNAAFAGLGFTSTPTLVNGNGKVSVGAMSADALLAFIDEK